MIPITEHLRYILAPSQAEVAIGTIVHSGDIQPMVRGSTEVLNYDVTQIILNAFIFPKLEVITILQLQTLFVSYYQLNTHVKLSIHMAVSVKITVF
jgi:hypothetical protein